MAEQFIVNSLASRMALNKWVDDLYAKHGYITFSEPRIGADRSLDQNALFHVWLTEYCAYATKLHKSEVSKGLVQGMKEKVKQKFTARHPDCYPWMTYEVIDPFTQEVIRTDYTSSKTWKSGEMFQVLTWFQMTAAEDGLILESKGNFAKLQRKSNGE
tara:strand:- start:12 stop:485 length:474 start_codon:yes stop_codon:yes gene_type:complete